MVFSITNTHNFSRSHYFNFFFFPYTFSKYDENELNVEYIFDELSFSPLSFLISFYSPFSLFPLSLPPSLSLKTSDLATVVFHECVGDEDLPTASSIFPGPLEDCPRRPNSLSSPHKLHQLDISLKQIGNLKEAWQRLVI